MLVLAPSGRDGELVAKVLADGGIQPRPCATIDELCSDFERADAAIIAEEALDPRAVSLLSLAIARQPRWSDFPLVVLGAPNRESPIGLFERLSAIANISLVERPTRPFTIVTIARAALRTRARQRLTRDYLDQLRDARERIASHRDELEQAVRKRTEELQSTRQLLRLSERMASIGALAAGMGHDLANLLLPLNLAVDAIATGPADEAPRHAESIRASLSYVGKLAGSLRLLALDPDRHAGGDAATELAPWWEELTPLVKLAVPRNATLDASIPQHLAVRVAPHRITQAILNLISNSGDVLADADAGRITVTASAEGPLVRISVSDNGPGMSEEVKARCLEPLFTTGTHEKSTGLGLSLVDGIVQAAGGRIEIESAPGKGTTFSLLLPAAAPAEQPGQDLPKPRAALSVSDPRMRSILSTLLARQGYEVEPKLSPERAPALWLTDPTDDAASIAELLRERSPETKIVVCGEAAPSWLRIGARVLGNSRPVSELHSILGEARDRPAHLRPGR